MEYCGNVVNFLHRRDLGTLLEGITMPVSEFTLFPYGIYRRVWNTVPIPYKALFPNESDLTVFFNFIVPPRVEGRVMSVVYDMTYRRFPETMEKKNLRRLEKGMAYSLRRSDHILTISEFSKREIMELGGVPEGKISVVPCAPSVMAAPADFREVQRRFPIERPYILYVGTIEPRKNLERLIRAFALLKKRERLSHQLVLAGGEGWKSGPIHTAAENSPYKEDILFTGFLSQSEKSALLKNAEVFVFPSLYEGFGIPPLEAMAMDCPVVCAESAALPEAAGDAAVYVDPYDEASIAEGMGKVLTDAALAEDLVRRGREQAGKYTWDRAAAGFAGICARYAEEL